MIRIQYVCFECQHPLLHTSKCPMCGKIGTHVGPHFQLPPTDLTWQGAKELAAMGEVFHRPTLSYTRVRRFVAAMKSPAVREYLKLWPVWYRHFEYFVAHPEETP